MQRHPPKTKRRPPYSHELARKVRTLAHGCGLSETYVRELLAADRRPTNRVLAERWTAIMGNLMAPPFEARTAKGGHL
jgi:hypothetical protein